MTGRARSLEPHEYAAHDGVGLAELIRSGEVSAQEVETAAREAIEAVDPNLNALTGPLFEWALSHRADVVFSGVPFLIKDTGPFARGVPFTLGSRAIRGAVPAVDPEMMSRFRASRGRWFEWRVCSSRGRRRCSPGSWQRRGRIRARGGIRVRVGGAEAQQGRTPSGPLVGEAGFGLVVEFALTRSVRDTAVLLDAVSAPLIGEKYSAAPPARPYAAELDASPIALRVAVTTEAWSGAVVDPQVVAATRAAADMLEWIGHHGEPASPPVDADAVVDAAMLAAVNTGAVVLRVRRPDPALLEGVSRTLGGRDGGVQRARRRRRHGCPAPGPWSTRQPPVWRMTSWYPGRLPTCFTPGHP